MKNCLFLIAVLLLSWQNAIAQPLLTERDAIVLALQNNFTIRIANTNQSVADNNATWGNAGFYPNVTFNGNFNQNIQRRTQLAFTAAGEDSLFTRSGVTNNNLSIGPALSWTLFSGLSNQAFYKQLQQLRTNSQTATRQAVQQTISQVVLAYNDIVQQQQVLKVRQDALTISEARLKLAEAREEVGAGSRLDYLQSRVDLNTDKSALLRQNAVVANARVALNNILAREPDTEFQVAESITVDEKLQLDILIKTGLVQNPDLELTRGTISSSTWGIKQFQADRWPTLLFNTGLTYAQQNASPFGQGFNTRRFFAEPQTFNFGFALNWTLFNGNLIRRTVANAKLQLNVLQLQLQQQELQFRADLARAYRNYTNSLDLIRLEEENLQVARKNVEVALERFKIGGSTALDLRTAQGTLIETLSRLVAAQFTAKQAETELYRLSGEFETKR